MPSSLYGLILTSSSSIHLLIDTECASVSWLLQMMTLWTLGFLYLFELVLLFSSDTSRSGITECHGSSVLTFLRHLPTVFHVDRCASSYSHQQHAAAAAAASLQSCPTLCDPIDGSSPGSPIPGILQAKVLEWGVIAFSEQHARAPCFPHSCQHFSLVTFLMIAFLTRRMWFFRVVLPGTSLMTDDVENLFMCPLAICMSSLEKCLFRSSAYFLTGLFVCLFLFLILSVMSCFYILEISPCQWHCLQIFSPDL